MFSYLALAAVASCVLTVAVAAVLLRDRIAGQRMFTLQRQADALATGLGGAQRSVGAGDHVYSAARGRERQLGRVRASAVLAALPATGDGQGTISVRGRGLLYVARATSAGRVVLIRPSGLAFPEWRAYLGNELIAGLGGVLLAAVLSFLLARRLVRPLRELAQATTRVAAGESGVAVPIRGEDELATLGRSFNGMSVELARAREAQRSFLESVSHELKTPLTSIRGYAEAVGEGAVAPEEGGRVIELEADRLGRLVQDLLDLARLGRAGFTVAHDRLDLAAVAAAAVQRHLPRARELSVELASSTGAPAWALGDPGRLLQATSNLVENALRLTPAGGTVLVSARGNQISVRDSGPGLREDEVPRAFERFYLHDRYRSERPVGSGLGLAIVRELVVAMGGTVEASRPAGGGAEFSLRLPAAEGAPVG
ncbi:MAG: sensor histidine kinase [Solirubrobacteraceae bacterium]